MKKVFSVKRIVKIISLLVAVIITALFMQQYILLHYDSNRLRLDGFYLEEKDTVDIALIGSSEVYASFAPGMAYDKFGFTSYDYATASCTPTAAITQVKEVMDNQSPKMILMEVNAFLYGADKDGQDLNAFKESSIRNYIDNIPMNDNKKAFLDEYVDKDLHIEYYLPIIKYHSAWNDYPDSIRYLRSCFEQQVRGESLLKGFKTRTRVFQPLQKTYNAEVLKDTKKSPLTETAVTELNKLMKYCKENKINIVFFRAPHLISDNNVVRSERNNTIAEMVRKNGFDFYDFERDYKKIGIDLKNDFYNYDHLNIYGCEKFTEYLGKLLVDKYNIGKTELNESQQKNWTKAAASFRKLYDYSDDLIKTEKKYITLEDDTETIEHIG
ncbi:MAG: hypothetical protein UH734_07240 [Ruminococcus sp.]|nr:hypothetical protein [Ruminococcus sp.]